MKKNSQKIFHQCLKLPTILPLLLLLLNFSQNAESTTKSTNSRGSGFYIDNGHNQAIIHRAPRNIKNSGYRRNVKIKGPPLNHAATQFLLNIQKTIESNDVVTTFVAQKKYGAPGVNPDSLNRIWFDVRSVKKHEKFLSAELHLYRDSFKKNSSNRKFRITVHRVVRSKNGERKKIQVDAVEAEFERVGWIILNISESLNFWINNSPRDNRGLTLTFHILDESGYRRSSPEEIGIVGFDGELEKLPFMAGFSKRSKNPRFGPVEDFDNEDDENAE